MSISWPKNCLKIALVSIISLTLFSFSREGEELKILDDLIATSERQLAIQKELKALIVEFHTQQDLFCDGPEKGQKTKELASQMVDTAMKIQQMAADNHYLHLLPPFFFEELKRFANVGKKQTPIVQP
jgi:hypothetical protein